MGRSGSSADYCRIEALYQEALDLPEERRAAFLREATNGDGQLQHEVLTLLEHFAAAGDDYLATPVFGQVVTAAPGNLPSHIGRYEVIKLLGQGGMGTVYEAQQPQPKRRVAIKVLRSDLATDHMLKRFQQEIEVLGQLRHPGIAQIHEAGMADVCYDGIRVHTQPFFVMELVRGQPLAEYADDQHTDTHTRLELFLLVCDAVQYAHQKGVIHRDLKPANILVDTTGQPKVLDFGVARATRSDEQNLTRYTQIGQLVGTLAYMSPEQIVGGKHQLDTRCDIYSLGVVLVELLTGQLPLDCRNRSLAEAAQIIQNEKPRALSEFNGALRGDLDTIVAKTLAKDPARRYQSAGELAADIRRHVRGEMIDAKRDSALYVFRKTLYRYRWPLIALHVFILLLGGFAIYALTQAQRYRDLAARERAASTAAAAAQRQADEQRHAAESQAERADAVKAFLQMMLVAADPAQARARDVTVREALDEAARQLQTGVLADQPGAELEIRETIARTYHHLGLYNSATPHYEWLLDSYVRRLGEFHPESVRVQCELATNYAEAYAWQAAKAAFERCLELTDTEHVDDAALRLAAMSGLGRVLSRMDQATEAESLHLEAVSGVEQTFGRESELYVSATFRLGDAYRRQGRLDEAQRLYLEALTLAEQLHGEESPVTVRIRRQLAYAVYAQTGRLDDAELLLRETLEIARSSLGAEHTETNLVLNLLSRVLQKAGKMDEAEQLLRNAIAGFSEIRGIEGHGTLNIVGELAYLLVRRGDPAMAARVLSDGIERAVQADGDEHDVLARWIARYSDILADGGDYIGALAASKRTLEIHLRLYGAEHAAVASVRQRVGWYLVCLGRYAEAADAFQQTLELRRRIFGETHGETIRTTITLALAKLKHDAQAGAAATQLMRNRYEAVRAELGDAHFNTRRAAQYYGNILSYTGKYTEAIAVDRVTLDALMTQFGADAVETGPWHNQLAMHLFDSGNMTDAIAHYRQALSVYIAHQKDRTFAAAVTKQQLAEALIVAGQYAEAQALARAARETLIEQNASRSEYQPWMMITLAHALTAGGKLQEAESLLRECLIMMDDWPLRQEFVDKLGGEARSVLGYNLTAQGRYAEAEPLLIEGFDMLQNILVLSRLQSASARSHLVELYDAWGKPAKAAHWRAVDVQ